MIRSIFKYAIGIVLVLVVIGTLAYQQLTKPPERTPDPVVTGINYVAMNVSNLDASQTLYQAAFALNAAERIKLDNNPVVNQLTQRSNTQLHSQLMSTSNAHLRFLKIFLSFIGGSTSITITGQRAGHCPCLFSGQQAHPKLSEISIWWRKPYRH